MQGLAEKGRKWHRKQSQIARPRLRRLRNGRGHCRTGDGATTQPCERWRESFGSIAVVLWPQRRVLMPEDNEKYRSISLRELKSLVSKRLRDPNTDDKSFVCLLRTYSKWQRWPRNARRPQNESNVDDIVLQLEREERLKRSKVANISDRKG